VKPSEQPKLKAQNQLYSRLPSKCQYSSHSHNRREFELTFTERTHVEGDQDLGAWFYTVILLGWGGELCKWEEGVTGNNKFNLPKKSPGIEANSPPPKPFREPKWNPKKSHAEFWTLKNTQKGLNDNIKEQQYFLNGRVCLFILTVYPKTYLPKFSTPPPKKKSFTPPRHLKSG